METIAFYSYTGGAGCSTLLAKTARFLAGLGRSIVALDLNFEAPSLHYKFSPPSGNVLGGGGVVPFLLDLAEGKDAQFQVWLPDDDFGLKIRLLQAGPAPAPEYWRDLAALNRRLDFSDPVGLGFAALLELKARIEDLLRPDFLLIDTRSGVTEIGGIATTLLADAVVCLALPFPASFDGTKAVLEGLAAAPRLAGQRPLRIFRSTHTDPVDFFLDFLTPGPSRHEFPSRHLDLSEDRDEQPRVDSDDAPLSRDKGAAS